MAQEHFYPNQSRNLAEQLDGLFGSGEGEEKLEGRVGIGAVPYYR